MADDPDNSSWEDLQNAIAGLMESLGKAQTALPTLNEELIRLEETVNGAVAQMQGEGERGLERVEGFLSVVDADLDAMVGEVRETGEALTEQLEGELQSLREVSGEFRDFLLEQTDEAWKEPVAAAVEAWQEDLEASFEEQAERFTEAGEAVRSAVMDALSSLERFSKEELSDLVEEEARETLETALERLRDEVLDGITTSNLQVQLTGFMAPILPQLMMVRMVAAVIKKLLDIMRMGF